MKSKSILLVFFIVLMSCSNYEKQENVTVNNEFIGKWQVVRTSDDMITQEEEESGIYYQTVENGRVVEIKNNGHHINLTENCSEGIYEIYTEYEEELISYSCNSNELGENRYYIELNEEGELNLGTGYVSETLKRIEE